MAAVRIAASLRPPSAAVAPTTLSAAKSASFGCASSLCPCTPLAASRSAKGRQAVVIPRADLDGDTLVGIGVGLAGIAVGIGIPVFYEIAVKGSEKRENDQPCFPCKGTGAQSCRFCQGTGVVVVELGGGEREESECINCQGKGAITCTTCQGTGVQPRYLDRREFKDDD